MNGFRRRLMAGFQTAKLTTIRIDQNLTDPATMITRIVDEGGIEAIRANSHRYVGVFDSTANLMSLRQLDDNDGTKYLDGTVAPITTLGNDVWMKLPKFFYKAEEYETDVWDITFVYGGKPDSTFKEWDGKDLIGVYKAYVSDSKMYSVSDMYPGCGDFYYVVKDFSHQRGEGFSLVKWKHHCMMAILFYAYYGTTDSQSVLGVNPDNRSANTGLSNSLCMIDSNGGVTIPVINFWGLENWYGAVYEWVDNVFISSREWTVTEDDGSERQAGTSVSDNGWIIKFKIGEYLDLIPTAVGGSSSTGYCDYVYGQSTSNRVLLRSLDQDGDSTVGFQAGVSFVNYNVGSSNWRGTWSSSRLSYRGDYIITD